VEIVVVWCDSKLNNTNNGSVESSGVLSGCCKLVGVKKKEGKKWLFLFVYKLGMKRAADP
jgi:hypothetical protein